ncbi:sensor histidine kinase [Microbulbifer sp. 2201CG32-9]|uniref:sensor histidine kinase n=1 Tax=Microbulbifer sp. 2201CG32-9 TaxID=3232309 RepID=UPI00345C0CE1
MFDYFKEGTGTATKTFLEDAARQDISGNTTQFDIYIRKNWSEFPEDFKKYAKKLPSKEGDIVKFKGHMPLLHTPDKLYYVLMTRNKAGDEVYVGKRVDWHKTETMIGNFSVHIYWRLLLLSIFFSAIFAVFLLFILRTIVSPLESLKAWAQEISSKNIAGKNTFEPKFRYKEISDIAEIITDSLARRQESIDREKEFLEFSSHELRSPLAVMKSNVDLLKKLDLHYPNKVDIAVSRLDFATTTMSRLVDTFLWLSRGDNQPVAYEIIDLEELVTQVASEMQYLTKGKPVSIEINTSPYKTSLPLMPCLILLRNLIGNAFQHVYEGAIVIHQDADSIKIANKHHAVDSGHNSGFGLGLRLVEKISAQYNWKVKIEKSKEYFQVVVRFS